RRFRPVLRGLLLTGREPRFLRRELSIDPGQEPLATVDSLWWPPAKIVGRHLGPFLASFAGADWAEPTTAAVPGAVEVEVVVDAEETLGHQLPPLDARYEVDDDRVEEAMSVATIVAPEDTLGEVAERLVANRARAAVVAEYGRVLGILTTSDLVRAAATRVSPTAPRARLCMTPEPLAPPPGNSPS